MRLARKDYILMLIQTTAWISLWLIPPLINFLVSFDQKSTFDILKGNGEFLAPLALIYFLNYFLLVPSLLLGRSRKWFWGVNLVLVISNVCRIFYPLPVLPDTMRAGLYMGVFAVLLMNALVVVSAVGARYAIRWNEMQITLKEEKQRNAEAELAWLKNQLNPHFLFNTLNNISSLVQIDQDTAQESIGQLSDLLRYTLYESNHELVPVEGEIEFMNNYIELMRLRCNELATVEVDLQIPIKPMRIVPLLFISLIENAFKHGVNSRKSSFVRIRFKAKGDDLVFTCENSDHPKPDVNRSGSGIGLENLRRRLDLAYPGRYRYDQELRENSYFVQITLRDCL